MVTQIPENNNVSTEKGPIGIIVIGIYSLLSGLISIFMPFFSTIFIYHGVKNALHGSISLIQYLTVLWNHSPKLMEGFVVISTFEIFTGLIKLYGGLGLLKKKEFARKLIIVLTLLHTIFRTSEAYLPINLSKHGPWILTPILCGAGFLIQIAVISYLIKPQIKICFSSIKR